MDCRLVIVFFVEGWGMYCGAENNLLKNLAMVQNVSYSEIVPELRGLEGRKGNQISKCK